MSFVDRIRASRLMAAAGLDALVIAEPEGFSTVTGASQGVAGLFRRAGAGFAVLPADPALPIGAVVGDLFAAAARERVPDARSHPLWMEQVDVSGWTNGPIENRIAAAWRRDGRAPGFARPATFDLGLALAALRAVLDERGLARSRLGFDLDYVAASDAAVIAAALPEARVLNGSPAFDRLRMVKTPAEIAKLRLGAELAEAGLRRMATTVAAGQTAADLHATFRAGVEADASRRGVPAPPSWDYIAIGPDPWRPGGRVAPGTVIKADVGCVVDGYSSDTSRNYVFAAPTPDQARLHGIIEAAFDTGFAAIRPGATLGDVHRITTAALEGAGLAGFSRGHFGHGLGHSFFSEQWPFITAGSDIVIEPDMVLAFEVPLYATGIGGFNLEDQLIVTEDGARSMNTLPRTLAILGA
ncbi:Xaa-Pro peptidase family protein [Lichenihabitans sp. Uapishka_5]|uniref:Xaa-Pro peptidase family protein n=1 Tax=Lichenihabitans sp. Uapishka_5 TaxID=3037302 RepID=UPI0029E7F26E|nr:Xaa-Pro peptidase family protein [Lichenihabitans sp. Uapishka_5]MDX7950331.1 Xaa-Pro peptidase family protein [Lichenihabitans sp. Uapishka_5]